MRSLVLLVLLILESIVKAQQGYNVQQLFIPRAVSNFGSITYGGSTAGYPYNTYIQNSHYRQEPTYIYDDGNDTINKFGFAQKPVFNNAFGVNVNNGFPGLGRPQFNQGTNTFNSQSANMNTFTGYQSGFNNPTFSSYPFNEVNTRPSGFTSAFAFDYIRPFTSSVNPFQPFEGNQLVQSFNPQTFFKPVSGQFTSQPGSSLPPAQGLYSLGSPGQFQVHNQGTGQNPVITATAGEARPLQGTFGPGQPGQFRHQIELVSQGPQLRPIQGIFGPGQPGQFDSQTEFQPVQAKQFIWK